MIDLSRRRFVVAAATASLAGCSGVASTTGDPGDTGNTSAGSAPVPTAAERLPLPMEPAQLREEARSGGPPKDGIPSVDDPSFTDPGGIDFLNPGDPVFGVVRDGAVKAYPQKILVHHEIVNDELGGTNVAVTYCPLTGTVLGFERGETTFGVSGRLINNNLVMYDRASETWWPQILGTSIPGPWNEDPPIESLSEFGLVWTTWKQWQAAHPDTLVMTTDTGAARNYGSDPYGGYNPPSGYYADGDPLFPVTNSDDRFGNKEVVLGARTPTGATAVHKETLLSEGIMSTTLGGTDAIAVSDPELDTGYVYLNPENRAFALEDGEVTAEDETVYAPNELPLTRVHTFDSMWFAWAAYYPDTNVSS
jgi:hypothetical protein